MRGFKKHYQNRKKELYGSLVILCGTVSIASNANADVYTKEWTKEEIQINKPAPVRRNDAINAVESQFISVLNSVRVGERSANKGLHGLQQKSKEINEDELRLLVGTKREISYKDTDTDAINTHLKTQFKSVMESRVKQQLPFLTSLNKGMNFEFGADSFNNSSDSINPTKSRSKPIYGLVLEGINPPKEKSLGFAAINTNLESELNYSSKANLVWKIGKIREEKIDAFFTTNKTVNENTPLPSLSFKANITPSTDIVNDLRNKEDPGIKYSIKQSENYYEYYKVTRNSKGLEEERHLLNIPIYGNLLVSKTFDEKGTEIKTDVNNLFATSTSSNLSVSYLHETNLYASKYTYVEGRHSFSFEATNIIDFTKREKMGIYKTNYTLVF